MNLPEGWATAPTKSTQKVNKNSGKNFPQLGEAENYGEAPEHSVFSKYILSDHLGGKVKLSEEHMSHALNHIDGVLVLAQEVAKNPNKSNCVRMHKALQGNALLDGKLKKKMGSALKVIFGEEFDADDSINSLIRYAKSKKSQAQGDSMGMSQQSQSAPSWANQSGM
jgi:hypothetical protein